MTAEQELRAAILTDADWPKPRKRFAVLVGNALVLLARRIDALEAKR